MLIKLIVAVILTEALAEILVASRLFRGFRRWIKARLPDGNLLRYFVKCGYCASVWCGVGVAYLLQIDGLVPSLGWGEPLIWGLVIHRASNVLHEGISRFLTRQPFAVFLQGHITQRQEPVSGLPEAVVEK
jgi:hypothetical protein